MSKLPLCKHLQPKQIFHLGRFNTFSDFSECLGPLQQFRTAFNLFRTIAVQWPKYSQTFQTTFDPFSYPFTSFLKHFLIVWERSGSFSDDFESFVGLSFTLLICLCLLFQFNWPGLGPRPSIITVVPLVVPVIVVGSGVRQQHNHVEQCEICDHDEYLSFAQPRFVQQHLWVFSNKVIFWVCSTMSTTTTMTKTFMITTTSTTSKMVWKQSIMILGSTLKPVQPFFSNLGGLRPPDTLYGKGGVAPKNILRLEGSTLKLPFVK